MRFDPVHHNNETFGAAKPEQQHYHWCTLQGTSALTPEEYQSGHDEEIAKCFAEIIKAESPIEKTWLCNRVREAFGIGRSGSQVQARSEAILNKVPHKKTLWNGKVFIWDNDLNPDVYVAYRANAERDSDRIAFQEIKNAVLDKMPDGVPKTAEELIRLIAEAFGYKRVASRIRETFGRAIRSMDAEGLLNLYEGEHNGEPSYSLAGRDIPHMPDTISFDDSENTFDYRCGDINIVEEVEKRKNTAADFPALQIRIDDVDNVFTIDFDSTSDLDAMDWVAKLIFNKLLEYPLGTRLDSGELLVSAGVAKKIATEEHEVPKSAHIFVELDMVEVEGTVADLAEEQGLYLDRARVDKVALYKHIPNGESLDFNKLKGLHYQTDTWNSGGYIIELDGRTLSKEKLYCVASDRKVSTNLTDSQFEELCGILQKSDIESWQPHYPVIDFNNPNFEWTITLDGTGWELAIVFDGAFIFVSEGSNAWPERYDLFQKGILSFFD